MRPKSSKLNGLDFAEREKGRWIEDNFIQTTFLDRFKTCDVTNEIAVDLFQKYGESCVVKSESFINFLEPAQDWVFHQNLAKP